MNIRALGDTALLVSGIADTRWKGADRFAAALGRSKPACVCEIYAAFDSVCILYDSLALESSENALNLIGQWLLQVFERGEPSTAELHPRTREIPVRYGSRWGPDLDEIADQLHLSADDVVRLHASASYRVLAIGFMPGFGYLGGLPEALKLPRRPSPRARVPAGSIGLGGQYTGIYPFDSPGGWHLIGQTSVRLFDPDSKERSLLRVGDVVRFVEVTR